MTASPVSIMKKSSWNELAIEQEKLRSLFPEICNLFKPGCTELEASRLLQTFLKNRGLAQNWHPPVIKFEESTLKPGVRHKPSQDISYQNIAYLDLGLVMNGYEVDYGATLSSGSDPSINRLVETAKKLLKDGQQKLENESYKWSPAKLHAWIQEQACKAGYETLSYHVGHSLGPFPTPKKDYLISEKNPANSFAQGAWVVEIHIGNGKWGAFFEDLAFVN